MGWTVIYCNINFYKDGTPLPLQVCAIVCIISTVYRRPDSTAIERRRKNVILGKVPLYGEVSPSSCLLYTLFSVFLSVKLRYLILAFSYTVYQPSNFYF